MPNYKAKNYCDLNSFFQKQFHTKVVKIPLSLGLTCPNRDGTLDKMGCLFCNNKLSGDFTSKGNLKAQFNNYLPLIKKKWPVSKYLPYLQAGSNTYGHLDVLKKYYEEALTLSPDVIGLALATRYDTLSDEMLAYLINLAKKYYIQLEIGLQSIHPDKIPLHRYLDLNQFSMLLNKLANTNIHLVVHLINGLPYESLEMMCQSITYLNHFRAVKGIKIHMLNILYDAPLYQIYLKNPFPMLTKEEYLTIITTQIRMLRPDIIIHRLTGDGAFGNLFAPQWIKKKFVILNEIDKIMWQNNFKQGDLLSK